MHGAPGARPRPDVNVRAVASYCLLLTVTALRWVLGQRGLGRERWHAAIRTRAPEGRRSSRMPDGGANPIADASQLRSRPAEGRSAGGIGVGCMETSTTLATGDGRLEMGCREGRGHGHGIRSLGSGGGNLAGDGIFSRITMLHGAATSNNHLRARREYRPYPHPDPSSHRDPAILRAATVCTAVSCEEASAL